MYTYFCGLELRFKALSHFDIHHIATNADLSLNIGACQVSNNIND